MVWSFIWVFFFAAAVDLHCFILLRVFSLRLKPGKLRRKRIRMQSWVQLRKKSENKKVNGNIPSAHSWGGAAGFAAAAVKAPEDFSKMLCDLDIAQIVLMQVLLENTLYLICRLGHRGYIRSKYLIMNW